MNPLLNPRQLQTILTGLRLCQIVGASKGCHPSNEEAVRADLAMARQCQGAYLTDINGLDNTELAALCAQLIESGAKAPRAIVEISGGVLAAVHSNVPGLSVDLLDHDDYDSLASLVKDGEATPEQRDEYARMGIIEIEGITAMQPVWPTLS